MKFGSWLWGCLCIPVYWLVDSTTGLTTTLTGSADYAVSGQTFKFICTIFNLHTPTHGTVSFENLDKSSGCAVTVSTCSQSGSFPGYSCGCVALQRNVYIMIISSVSVQKDEGKWLCRHSSSINIMIYELPVYYGPYNSVTLDKSSPQRVTETSSLKVVCSSDCKPCSYTWRRETVYVSGTRTLSLTNINRNQAGDYICTATNTALGRTASSTLTVDVQYGPTNSGFQETRVLTESSTITYNCSSDCKPCSYTWRRGTVTVSNTRTLSLTNINRTQTGDYICTATNTELGTTASSTLRIDVQYAPVIQVFPSVYKVIESSRFQIDCSNYTTAGNTSTTSYRWTYRGSTISSVSFLDINNINRTQSGQYTCTVNNTAGSDSATVSVDVQYPASITSFTINSNTDTVTVSESDNVTMRCQLDIDPGSTIRLLNGSSELSRADNSLTVEYAWTTDCRQRGKYECVASNNIGGVTKSVHLFVTCTPKREVNSRHEQLAAVGDDATLSLTILSYPEPVISWFKTNSLRNLTSIASVSRVSDVSVTVSLTLTGVQQQDFGEYFVQADNGIGIAPIFSVRLSDTTEGGYDTKSPGTGLGIGFGVCIPIVIIIVASFIVLYRRKVESHKEEMKKCQDGAPVNTISELVTGRVVYSTLDPDTPTPVYARINPGVTGRAVYSTLDPDTPTPVYERINPGETTADQHVKTDNEGDVHLYVN